MNRLTRYLLKLLGLTGVGFLIANFAIGLFFPIPEVAVLVDRSFCPPEQWQNLSQTYGKLYRQNQQKQILLNPVILFSDLGEEVLKSPLEPQEFRTLKTFGRSNDERLSQLKTQYTHAEVLNCSS
ncbi:MAG: hypothetical protein AAFO04_15380 [Cyanobacteria bacterium J06592_8]